jgi:gas vesicle protein
MKLTEQKLRQLIRHTIREASTIGYAGDTFNTDIEGNYDVIKKKTNKLQMSTPGFTSKEARAIVEKQLKQHSKMLKKVKYNLIKDWLQLAKSGKADYFDVMRVVRWGDIRRASGDELNFMKSVLMDERVENGFRRYYKGKKGMPTRKWK